GAWSGSGQGGGSVRRPGSLWWEERAVSGGRGACPPRGSRVTTVILHRSMGEPVSAHPMMPEPVDDRGVRGGGWTERGTFLVRPWRRHRPPPPRPSRRDHTRQW